MTKMQNEKIHECKIILCVTNPTATLLAIKPDMDKEFGIESKLAVINGKLEIIIKANNLKSLMKTSSFVFERVKLSEDTIEFSEENDLLN